MEMVDVIGWAASGLLVLTVSCQVWKQWQDTSTAGVSHWLFAGQIAASFAFLVYSWLLGNIIFTVSNGVALLTAIVGQVLYLRNRRLESATG
jgi:uncharacterized protein with PQ loop repeat